MIRRALAFVPIINTRIRVFIIERTHPSSRYATSRKTQTKKIHAIILETDEDIKEVKELIKTGEIFGINKLNPIKKKLKLLAKHFKDAKFFESVENKTERMVKKKVIPKYMIDYYLS